MGFSDREPLPLTDAEIKAKAAALGMVEPDSMRLSASDEASEEEKDPGDSSGAKQEETPAAAQTEAPSQTPSAVPTEAPATEPEAEAASIPSAESGSIIFTIRSGVSSDTVCSQLEEDGLVESAAAFDQFLINNGYSRKISAGEYEIPVGATEEEIAKIITKTR